MAHILPFRLLIIDPITELRESLALNMQIKNSLLGQREIKEIDHHL